MPQPPTTQQASEQQALTNTLATAPQGGQLAAGANVPQVLNENPALRQLLQESIATQTGTRSDQLARQNIVTSEQSLPKADELVARVDNIETFQGEIVPQVPDLSGFELQRPNTELKPGGLTSEQEDLFDRSSALTQNRYQSAVDSIRATVDRTVRDTETKQRQSQGATSVQLARMGALNVSTAGVQYVNDLTNTHNQQIIDLRMQGEALIAEARNARDSADLTQLSLKVGALESNKRLIMDEQNNYLNQIEQIQRIVKLQKDSVTATIDAIAGSGMTREDVPEQYLLTLDKNAGYPPGVSGSMLDAQKMVREAASEKQYYDTFKSVMDIAEKLRPEQFIQFGGQKIYGQKSNMEFKGSEVDSRTGDITSIWADMTDPANPTMRTITERGVLSPNIDYDKTLIDGKWWHVPKNPEDGPAIPITGDTLGGAQGVNVGAIKGDFPEGMRWGAEAKAAGFSEKDFWCLRFIGNMDERGQQLMNEVGNSISQKRASAEKDIGFGEGQQPPRVGDYILTNESAQYGHIALITDIRLDENGNQVAVLTESNYKPLTVTHSRTIRLDGTNMEGTTGGKIMGFKRSQLVDGLGNQSTTQLGDTPKPKLPEIVTIDGKSYERDPVTGELAPLVIPATPLTQVEIEQNKASSESARTKAAEYGNLLNMDGFNNAVGGAGLFQRSSPFGVQKSARNDFIGSVQLLTSTETLDTLINLKKAGGALGALNADELKMLRDSATKINNWQKTNNKGEVVGYEIGQGAFIQEVRRLQDLAQKAYDRSVIESIDQSLYEIIP